jgi:hypothetical protein
VGGVKAGRQYLEVPSRVANMAEGGGATGLGQCGGRRRG